MEPVETLLCYLYYLYAKSAKKHNELKNIFNLLKEGEENIIEIVDSSESTKEEYGQLLKKLKKNNKLIFGLLTFESVTDTIKSNEKEGQPLYQNQKVTIVCMLLLIGTPQMSFLSSHTSVNIHHADEGDIIFFGIFYMLICIMWPQLTIKENLSTYFN